MRSLSSLILILLAACATVGSHPGAPPPGTCATRPDAPPRFTREHLAAAVEPIAQRAVREQKVVGLSVGIAHQGEPVYLAGFGMADLENQRSATADTQYDVGSINKMFTAVLLLQFAERGLLDLDDPVSRHLPDYDGPMRTATIRQLLNHTSGFYGPEIDETREQPELEHPQSVAELLALPTVAEARRSDPPGMVFRYSDSAFHLLGTVVQVIAAQSYGEVAREQVFRPAGMTSSVAAEWPTGPHAAVAYMWQADQLVRPPPIHPSALGGAVITSVRDLLSFQCALDAGMLISPASLALKREPTLVRIREEAVRVPYGLATMMGPFEARQKIGHQGTWPGGSAQLAHYPDDDLTIVVLTNTNREGTVQARQIGSWIAHALFGDEAPGLSRSPLPIDEEFARIATGRFRWNGFVNEVTWEEGELRVRNPESGELSGRLLRVGPLATTYIPVHAELTDELPAYRLANPPYELSIHSPGGDWILWFREGGMFWDVGRRVGPELRGGPRGEPGPVGLDLDAIADAIVHRSAGVQQGELVWIQGGADELPLMERMAVAVGRVGAYPLVSVYTDEMLRRWYREVPEQFDTQREEWLWHLRERADVAIEFHSLDPTILAEIPAERDAAWTAANAGALELARGRGARVVFVGNRLYPSEGQARSLGVEREELERLFWSGLMARPEDLAATGARMSELLRGGGTIRVTHPNGTDLSVVGVGTTIMVSDGRVVRRPPGDASQTLNVTWLPGGEVTLGVEPGSAEGRLVIERLVFDGEEIRDITLLFSRGRLQSMHSNSDLTRLRAVIGSDPPMSERLTGLKLGTNPNVSDPRVLPLMGAGMVSLSMGSNVSLGGDVDLPFMIFLSLVGATIEVDGRVLVRDGEIGP